MAISNPPEYGVVVVLNPFFGSCIYSSRSLYSGLARPVLSASTIAPRLSRGLMISNAGNANGVQTMTY